MKQQTRAPHLFFNNAKTRVHFYYLEKKIVYKYIMSISNPSMVETCSVPILFDLDANKRVDLGAWVLNNRREFPDFLNHAFLEAVNMDKRNVQYAFDANTQKIIKVELLRHQKFISDFLSRKTPYRGCLLYYGLGSGKTLSSINIAEGIHQKTVVLLPASIQTNFEDNIQKKGSTVYHTQNHWCFIEMANPQSSQSMDQLSKMGFPIDDPELIKKLHTKVDGKNGFWVVQKNPGENDNNFELLSAEKQESIKRTVQLLKNYKYHFVHYNGGGGLIRKIMEENIPEFKIQEPAFLQKLFPGITSYDKLLPHEKKVYKDELLKHIFDDKREPHFTNPFENKVIIIDEVHNFMSQICNNSSNAVKIYQLLLRTRNSRIVALSGTPVINSPFELCLLFNLLKGYSIDFCFKIKKTTSDIKKMIDAYSRKQTLVDYCGYDSMDQIITFSRMPVGFRRNEADQAVRHEAPFMSDELLIDDFKREFAALDPNFLYKKFHTIFPDIFSNKSKIDNQSFIANKSTVDLARDKFYEFYVDRSASNIKNSQEFLLRCLGLISFFNESYKYGSKIFPDKIQGDEPDWVDVSDFQLIEYNRQREVERKLEKVNIAKNDVSAMVLEIDSKVSNVFKVFSRQKLLFTFPPGIERPTLKQLRENLVSGGIVCSDAVAAECSLSDRDLERRYNEECARAIRLLTREHLTINDSPFALQILSPKYAKMLENINATPGIIFCYSQFRNVEGIEIFCRVLNENGYERYNPDQSDDYQLDNPKAHQFEAGQMARYEAEPDRWITVPIMEILEPNKCRISVAGEARDVLQTQLYRCRFATWSGTENVKQRETIRQNFNNLQNKFGQVLLIILATSSGAEGIDLMNVRQVHIMEPYWNKVREEQVIGRARRNYSHVHLPKDQQNVYIFQYVSRFSEEQKNGTWGKTLESALLTEDEGSTSNEELKRQVNMGIAMDDKKTSDEALLTISNQKFELIAKFLDVIKQGAVDCEYNKAENILSSPDEKAIECLNHIPGVGNSITYEITKNPEIREEGLLETIIGKELYIINYPGRNIKLLYEINKGEELTQITNYVPLYNFYSFYGINPTKINGNTDSIGTKRLIGSLLFDKDVGKMKIILSQEFMSNSLMYERVQQIIADREIPSIDQSQNIYKFSEEITHHPDFEGIQLQAQQSELQEAVDAPATQTKKIKLNIRKNI